MTPKQALEALEAQAFDGKAVEMAAYHKVDRIYFGVSNPQIDAVCKDVRSACDVSQRVEIAAFLWDTNIHEARVAAAKILTQARIKPDDTVWQEICRWVSDFDAWAITDHACSAGARRLTSGPERLDTVETWTADDNMWVRCAALVMTLPWTKMTNPKPQELEQRERILGWAANYVDDKQWFIQKAIGWWLRSLSKHDAPRVQAFLDLNGDRMKPFARKEAAKYL